MCPPVNFGSAAPDAYFFLALAQYLVSLAVCSFNYCKRSRSASEAITLFSAGKLTQTEDREEGSVSLATYGKYFKAAGGKSA